MMYDPEFDEIRPYNDNELPAVFEALAVDRHFRKMAQYVYPNEPYEVLVQKMKACKTKLEFQKITSYPFIQKIVHDSMTTLSIDLSVLKDTSRSYTYISNHRDIILDSGFLSVLLVREHLDTVEIAIGDNLLIYPWIKELVRLNKAFIVQRGLSMRQKLLSSARLSRYIHYTIIEKKQSVWIAQRQGRAKDSNDLTQEGVVKMLSIGGSEGDMIDKLMEINITPLAVSYEYDPCDYLKAKEFQLKRDNKDYVKTMQDDLINMQTGLTGYKGAVHLQVSPCINDQLSKMDRSLSKLELSALIATLIDKCIHASYRIFTVNYIALDLLNNNSEFSKKYTVAEKTDFEDYISGEIDKINIPNKDINFLRTKMLCMYANPLINYLKVTQ